MNRTAGLRLCAALVAAAVCAFGIRGLAQGFQPPPPPGPLVHKTDDPILRNFTWRSIGPASMGGRLDDIAVVDSNPSIIYLGFATGGVWKSINNGPTWTPIVDEEPVTSIGDIAIAPSDPNVVYVGTGEANNRQSASFGAGVYKSTDAGEHWTYVGLKETQSIARIVVNPKNPDIVYVAAVGHLFGPNPDRGLYKTTDGGKTWTNAKFINNDTGFTDVSIDPVNPNVLYAASYQRRREPWGFNGGGPGSGIWKTTDAGKTWTKLTGNGLPDNPIIGRIGLDVARSHPQTIYASIEVGPSGGTGAGVNDDGTLQTPEQAARGEFGSNEPQPDCGQGNRGRGPVTFAPPNPNKSGIWRSDDSGKTWRFLSNCMDRPMYYSQIRVDPTNPDIAYQGGAPFFKTTDGGKQWHQVQGLAHSDHHAIWIDPRDHNHVMVGNDGGLDVTYDQADTWEYVNNIGGVGQFYKISADMRTPYYVCGGLQDNGSFCGPSAVRGNTGILNSDWYRVGGGDGFYTANDPTDWGIMYSESQDGATSRLDLHTGQTVSIRPRGPAATGRGAPQIPPQLEGLDPALLEQFGFGPSAAKGNIVPPVPAGTTFRFYWDTPFMLSPLNASMIYLGGDRLFKSLDRGATWSATPDLTRDIGRNDRPIMGVPGSAPMASKHDGAAAFSNIVTVGESAAVPGIVWVGTNDGNLQ
ncbi:MAG: WD40/YVTN/BNR-like repeat-containing protein, partial [Vicinamibacterales bacterium]